MLTQDCQLRVQTMEKSLHSLLFSIHHERSKLTQLIEPVDEMNHRKTTLAKGDEGFCQVVPLGERDKLVLESEKKSIPGECVEVEATSDHPPPVQGGAIQVLGSQVSPLEKSQGYAGECLITCLNPS